MAGLERDVSMVRLEEAHADETAAAARDERRKMLRIAGGAAAFLLLVGAVVAGVLASRSPSMRPTDLPERVTASFTAKAQDGTEAEYRGVVHKVPAPAGSVSAFAVSAQVEWTREDGATQRNTVLDNRAYFEVVDEDGVVTDAGCYSEDDLPPYNDMEEAFANAVEVPADADLADYATGRCADNRDSLVTISWAGDVYVFCSIAGGDSLGLTQFVGEGFVADIFDVQTMEAVADAPSFTAPTAVDGSALECPELTGVAQDIESSVSGTRRRLIEGEPLEDGEPHPEFTQPWYLRVADETDAAGRREARTRGRALASRGTCLFIHGLGNSEVSGTTSSHSYWGKVHEKVHCPTKKFMHIDTVNVAWDDATNLDKVCDAAAGGHSGQTISDTKVFTHSMGTVIFARALVDGRCVKGGNTEWYAVGGPNTGSRAADWAADICTKGGTLGQIAGWLGFCNGNSPAASVGSLQTGHAGYSAVVSTVASQTNGILCGTSSYGLNTVYAVGLQAIDWLINNWRDSSRDGVVEFNACGADTSGFSTGNAGSSRFSPNVNHLDETCRNGDGWYGGDARKPCRWYDRMG